MTITPQQMQALETQLNGFDHLLVAFSGGVDSTLLLAEAVRLLGKDRVIALTALSPTLPAQEQQEAQALAQQIGATSIMEPTHEMNNPAFTANGPDRCYHCKTTLFDLCDQILAKQDDPQQWAIAYGANLDDLGDHRPGMDAARERGIYAPLLQAKWGKDLIRARSHQLGLPTADKAAMACLSSRFPTHTPITLTHLNRVEKAENLLRKAGFKLFRVRFEGNRARIELGQEELYRLDEELVQTELVQAIKHCGFEQVYLDPKGYRTGGANTPH
ncbi:ATP-dependent sacrificial sulfur transferase LarE [Magnetococcus sp. PR-3]|uniref:ATP-dependent sacrificial sulfur transferase LarE n=1 Tax=Magnetococcus sp. PR-3 TaxID=3120355 RepID=UPI002FCE4A8B